MLLPSSTETSPLAWRISLLLLLATMLNYMDRQTLSNVIPRVATEFELTNEQRGHFELAFGWAFAVGSLTFGMLVDRVSVRWLYPAVLTAWSAMGFLTGLTTNFESMLICRMFLGFFEAGHWPCALAVTHAVLSQKDRTLGNSILQSGASLGAILTPLIIVAMIGKNTAAGAWRPPFVVIGVIGLLWCLAWFAVVRPDSIPHSPRGRVSGESRWTWLMDALRNPRFWALVVVVVSINAPWQLIRFWLPSFLQEGRGYSEKSALYFNSIYYLATDVGCILSGAAVLWMARRGMHTHKARVVAFGVCALLTSLTIVAGSLDKGWLLLAVLLIVAAGSLGMFPCYYSMAQEIDSRNVGKVTGLLGFLAWATSSPMQPTYGAYIDETGSYDLGLSVAGCIPFLGLLAILLLWRTRAEPAQTPDAAVTS